MSKQNQYFNFQNKDSHVEADTFRQQLDELVGIYGIDVLYIPRTQENLNKFLGEDQSTKFETAYEMVCIADGLESFNTGESIFSKFGLTTTYTTTLYIEKTRFKEETEDTLTRPRVGDLVYIPIMNRFFEISFENDLKEFFFHGQTFVYKIELAIFRYSHEEISTGVDEIDDNVPDDDFSNDVDNDVVDDLNITEAVTHDYEKNPVDEE